MKMENLMRGADVVGDTLIGRLPDSCGCRYAGQGRDCNTAACRDVKQGRDAPHAAVGQHLPVSYDRACACRAGDRPPAPPRAGAGPATRPRDRPMVRRHCRSAAGPRPDEGGERSDPSISGDRESEITNRAAKGKNEEGGTSGGGGQRKPTAPGRRVGGRRGDAGA